MRVLTCMADARRRESLEKLEKVAETANTSRDPSAVVRVAGLSGAQRSWLNTLVLDPMSMTPSSGTLRVVARVTGLPIDRERRLSDGRVELAKMIGVGEEAAARNAALHRIGSRLCRSNDPRCGDCPLLDECAAAR